MDVKSILINSNRKNKVRNNGIKITTISFLVLFTTSVLFPIDDVFAATTFVDSLDVSGQSTTPFGVTFNADGTKMFVTGIQAPAEVNEYACTTGFDVSTCTYSGDGEKLTISGQTTFPTGLVFNTAGTKLFVLTSLGDEVIEYACTTGFDVSTCTYSGDGEKLDVSGQASIANALAFNSDGTKLFVTDNGAEVNEYACTTGFDVSTCTYSGNGERLTISPGITTPGGLAFNSDGTKMFVVDNSPDDVNEFSCTTGFDVSTCTFTVKTGNPVSVNAQETSPAGLAFNTAGTKMFIVGLVGQDVNEFTLDVGFDLTAAAPDDDEEDTGNRGGNGACKDCFPPTLGIDQNGKRVVEFGFTYNGQKTHVEKVHTPFPLITVNVGQENVAELIVYENRGERKLTHVALGFGFKADQHFGDSKVIIEWDRTLSGEETITQIDPNDIIDDDSLRIESSKTKCTEDGVEDRCTLLKVFHKFRNVLDFNIVKTYVWDLKRNGWQNTYNHGIEIQGKSMNAPIQHVVYDKRDKTIITEITKNYAVDEYGNTWKYEKSWKKDYKPILCTDTFSKNGRIDRDNCLFNAYKQGQKLLAEQTLVKICPSCVNKPFEEIDNIFAYDIPTNSDRSVDPILQDDIADEILKAEQTLQKMYVASEMPVERNYLIQL